MNAQRNDSSSNFDDHDVPHATQGRFIGYASTFPPDHTPRNSHVRSLAQSPGRKGITPVTDKEIAERRTLQLQTAAMILHDWNNILVALGYHIDRIAEEVTQTQSASQELDALRQAARQLNQLSGKLSVVCRGGPQSKPDWIEIPSIIHETIALCLCRSNIRVEYGLSRTWPIRIDAVDFLRIIQNLILNACRAMEHGGTLRIRTENIPSGSGLAQVEITISDDGRGIPPQDLETIFEPSFTTKTDGHGLGLAFVKAAVTKYGGTIHVASELGHGTVFTLRFPAKAPKP
jgi:signal transduction histidine kinase